MRMLATIVIQPHIKNKLTPQKLLPFSWDKQKIKVAAAKAATPEERRAHFEQLVKKFGDHY